MKKILLYMTMLVSMFAQSSHLAAMDDNEDPSFWYGALERAATTIAAMGASQCISETQLPQECKMPLYVATFTVGMHGLNWYEPVPALTPQSKMLAILASTAALAGSWPMLQQLNLSDSNRKYVFAALFGINIWRYYKATEGRPSH